MPKRPLQLFFEEYIKGTIERGFVSNERLRIGYLTNKVGEILGLKRWSSIYISSRALKHMYDKKAAEEFDAILLALSKVVKYPLRIYRNKIGKKGNYCLVGKYKQFEYVCAIEIVSNEAQVVTCFRNRDSKYLNEYILLWSRENDVPPS